VEVLRHEELLLDDVDVEEVLGIKSLEDPVGSINVSELRDVLDENHLLGLGKPVEEIGAEGVSNALRCDLLWLPSLLIFDLHESQLGLR